MLRGQGRTPGALCLLLRAPEGARRRARHPGEPRGRAALPRALPRRRARVGRAARSRRGRCGRAAREPPPRPRAVRPRARRSRSSTFLPRRFEVGFGTDRSAPGAAARARARRGALRQREDRPDRHRPAERARDRAGLQVREGLVLGPPDRRGAAAPGAAVHARAPRPGRDRAARRRLPGALRVARAARGMLRAEAREELPGFKRERLPRRGAVLGAGGDRARARARRRPADPRRGGRARPEGGECPSWCDLWTMCRVRA